MLQVQFLKYIHNSHSVQAAYPSPSIYSGGKPDGGSGFFLGGDGDEGPKDPCKEAFLGLIFKY